jgi:hypothetical protein
LALIRAQLSANYDGSAAESENCLTRAITIIALTSLVLAGAAMTSILGRDSVPAVRAEMTSPALANPATNRERKQDRLVVASLAPASLEPPQTASLGEPIRQAFASTAPAEIGMPKIVAAPPKPKLANKPAAQKPYALLSDAQIAGIKERLRLSSAQEYYWPAVENALRAVARKIHATRQTDPHATGVPIDPEAAEVQQLKSAAMPLLFQLREDQKQEVRTLARLIGLEKVAAQI